RHAPALGRRRSADPGRARQRARSRLRRARARHEGDHRRDAAGGQAEPLHQGGVPAGRSRALSQALAVISIRKTGKQLGAEVTGIDLSRALDDATFARIRDAFFEHQVMCFRAQTLTPAQQIAFTRRFGELEHHVRKEHRLPDHPEILVVSNVLDERGAAIGVQDAGRFWHSDLSSKQVPSLLSALYALEVPVKDGRVLGATSFASAAAAYDALPEDVKARLQRLRNVHSYRYYRAKNIAAQKE